MDKQQLKEALAEIAEEEKTAAEKEAAERSDAFDLGIQVAMREMGIQKKQAQEQFLGFAQKVANFELSQQA